MFDRRRRIFYVDKIFQKKLLFLFLGLNILIVITNIVFYFSYIRMQVEGILYRSHIDITNIREVITSNVIRYNLILAGISLLISVIFYLIVRHRIKIFFYKVKKALQIRMEPKLREKPEVFLPEEFKDVDRVLQEFFALIDESLASEQQQINLLKKSIT